MSAASMMMKAALVVCKTVQTVLIHYCFEPNVTAVACKRPQSFCQMCRWQVTAKHSYTLRMWLCMK